MGDPDNVIRPKQFDPDHWEPCPQCLGAGCVVCDGRGQLFRDRVEPDPMDDPNTEE